MMKKLMLWSVLGLASGVLACGGGDKSPTAPPPPPLANFTGIYSGSYQVTTCTHSGVLLELNLCGLSLGQTLPFSLNVAQRGTDNGVQGNFMMGTLPFTIAPATVTTAGVTFNGTYVDGPISIVVTFALTSPVKGTISQVWRALSGPAAAADFSGAITVATKTGSIGAPAPLVVPTTVEGLVRAIQ